MLRGFDVSAYQGTTAPSGADFIIVKATEGSGYTNSKYAAQIASARTKAKVVGAYHFARPEQSSAKSQADRFLAVAKPGPRDLLCLDLEASDLNQSATNAWAIAFAERLKERVPGNPRVIYMGSGYASNGTGRNLNQHYDLWWYPQYPSTAKTSTWRATFTPWLPSGLTCGWKTPHIWQWTSDFNGLDANITPLTIDQLAGGGGGQQPTPQEEDEEMASTGVLQARANVPNGRSELTLSIKNGTSDQLGIWGDPTYDNPDAGYPKCGAGQFRVIAHVKSRTGVVMKDPNKDSPTYNTEVITVGFEADGKGWCDKAVVKMPAGKNADAWKVYRLDNEPCQFGADISHS